MWQKRGLSRRNIFIWLIVKISLEEIDHIISAEITDKKC